MAKYTTQIRSIVESGYPLFDFEYPLFDSKYKSVLEQKIIDHYFFREIGFETVGQFKHFLKSKLNMIMPYYNQLYAAEKDFEKMDPFINKDLTTTDTRTNTVDSTGKTVGANTKTVKNKVTNTGSDQTIVDNENVFSDTPQAKLQGLDYATNMTKDNGSTENTSSNESNLDSTDQDEGSTTSEGNITTTDEYVSSIKGFDGMKYASEVLIGLRESFINIDQMIVEELNDLFMNIY